MDPAFEQAVFSLKLNEAGMVKTDYGYHVVQVLEKDANRAIEADIQQALGDQAINTYMENLRTDAKIERLVKTGATATPSQ
jgi:peptidyl-prolyl cis-trans isomerase C